MKCIAFGIAAGMFCISFLSTAQEKKDPYADRWVDSVFNSLSKDEKIAQLMVVRAHSDKGDAYAEQVADIIRKYNVGALCFFQGGPVRQANYTNYYQTIAKTPLLITIDAEWGLGMRLDSVIKFPYQLTLGAISNSQVVYQMGLAVGEQCRRMGIHVNYAPVVDINNNPNNPVIGYRSFGEDKNRVAQLGIAYMKGMQDAGIMACAKHFPGHGDVDVDSHYDLPVINKTRQQLNEMELMPFRELFNAGVGSVMIAHLFIPSLDDTKNTASSISKNSVTGLLRQEMGYEGLTFTDALEMKGVSKYFPGGTIAVEALIAGNDMLCLPESVPGAIEAVKKAIKKKRLDWEDIDKRVKKVLYAKYRLGLSQWKPVNTASLTQDLNEKTNAIRSLAAKNTITLLRSGTGVLPQLKEKKVACIGIGVSEENLFLKRMRIDWNADVFTLSYNEGEDKASLIAGAVSRGNYDVVIVGIHNYSLRPANNYNISAPAVQLAEQLQALNTATFVFGNVLAIKNFCAAKTLVACYQDDDITQEAAADMLSGYVSPQGRLPVSVCGFSFGHGIVYSTEKPGPPVSVREEKFKKIDSIAEDAISKKAFPGCVVLAVQKGEIIYHKAFGNTSYQDPRQVTVEKIYDLASVTKISATTIAVMKLYEQGKISLKKNIGDYLPWVRGTDKATLNIRDILLHQAGLVPFIPFYKEIVDSATGMPSPVYFAGNPNENFTVGVAENIFLRKDYPDTMMQRILQSPLTSRGKYVYSDNDFIFLGKMVEQISGMTLDQYVSENFYKPMGLTTTGYLPKKRFPANRIVPTENEPHFRRQLLHGYVHDEGASLFGGVAGHAGLFSDAYDLGMLYQMLLNGGELNGKRYLKKSTIDLFTAYGTPTSRRGLGFDKPERELKKGQEPYPCKNASPKTFGHTGFTGTCVWVDPAYDLVYVFLSNRVNPTRHNPLLQHLNVRGKIQDAIYEVIKE